MIRLFRRVILCVLCGPILFLHSASAGSVRTLDGKNYDGDLRLEKGQVVLSPRRGGEPIRLNLADVLTATFHSSDPARPQVARPVVAQNLDHAWKTQDVGPTGTPGSVALVDGRYAVKGAGANIKGTADSFYFAYQELHGDGQIIARLSDLQLVNPDEKAGLMIREKYNERGSKCAFLYFKPQDGSGFSWRAKEGGEMAQTPLAASDKPPAWLKLSRVRGSVSAFKSLDGETWIPVGTSQDLPMDQRVFIGLAVCSRDTNAACAATFETVKIQQGRQNEEPPPRMPPAADRGGPMLHRAIILRSGAVIGNAQIQSADDQSVHVVRDGKPLTLATSDVARLILAPVSPAQLAKVPPTGSGVLLGRGDFMEGEFESLKDGRLKLNSIVFGPANLAAGSEALIVVLHDITGTSGQASWIVRTTEGFVYMAKTMTIDRESLVIDDELAGSVRVNSGSVAELKAGGGRFDTLADLHPEKVEASHGFSTSAAFSMPASISLAGLPNDRPLLLRGGTSITYNLDGKYKIFLARAGVPDDVIPMLAARVTASVDGKEVYRSPPLTSFDEPAAVACPTAGGKQLVIRVEALGDPSLSCVAALVDAVIVK